MSLCSLRDLYSRHCQGATFMISLNPHNALRVSTLHFIDEEHEAQRVELAQGRTAALRQMQDSNSGGSDSGPKLLTK